MSPPPTLTIGAVQPRLRQAGDPPIAAVAHEISLMRRAAAQHDVKLDLFVLPELSPIGHSDEVLAATINSIELMLSELAKELNCFICYGTIGILDGDENDRTHEQFTIRQNVVDNTGILIGSYDKMHLCNYGDCAETRYFVPGTRPCSFHCRGFEIGIIICADMRNPSLCRLLAGNAHKCDIILQPAAFSRDISFRTWKSFRETRAVENSVYFVGDNYGNTSFVEPWVDEHHEPEVLGAKEGVLVKEARRDILDKVRKEFPYYEQLMGEDWTRDGD